MAVSLDAALIDAVSEASVWLLADAAIKATALLLLVSIATGSMQGSSAATRHLLWVLAIASLPFIPVVSRVVPGWRISSNSSVPAQLQYGANHVPSETVPTRAMNELAPAADLGAGARPHFPPGASHTGGKHAPSQAISWQHITLFAWVVGAAVAFLPWPCGVVRLRRLERQSISAIGAPIEEIVSGLTSGSGTGRRFRLQLDKNRAVPLQWGILCPRIVLPGGVDEWPRERIRVMLLHELAHIRRWDCLSQLVARCVCALFWFHPLVWRSERRMRLEAEAACDDITLTSGCSAVDYAEHLIWIAANRTMGSDNNVAGTAMAGRSELEERVSRILSCTANRRRMSPSAIGAIAALLVTMIVPMLLVRVQAKSSHLHDLQAETRWPIRLEHGDGTAAGRRSLAGAGHAVAFTRPTMARYLAAVEIFASRYGTPEPPAEDFHLYVLDHDQRLIRSVPFRYEMIDRGPLRWYTLSLPVVDVPEQFYVALTFNPHSTKGIYLAYDDSVATTHSYVGRPTTGFHRVTEKYDWMIRPVLVPKLHVLNPFEADKKSQMQFQKGRSEQPEPRGESK